MEVVFKTGKLQRNYQESKKAVQQWGPEVARKYITRIDELYALKNLHEAYSIQSMRLHPLKNSKKGELSIDLTGQWRLIVTVDAEDRVTIEKVSNHYGD